MDIADDIEDVSNAMNKKDFRMFKFVLMLDLIAQMVLHLLFYFLNACDFTNKYEKRKRIAREETKVLVHRLSSDTGILNSTSGREKNRYINVFPDYLVNENEY